MIPQRYKSTKAMAAQFLSQLHSMGKLELNPDYQRQAVWTTSQKRLLIDSMLRDFDVPKLYFRKIEGGGVDYEVVDGQQRVRAIAEFFQDLYELDTDADDVSGKPIKGRVYSSLPTELQMSLSMAQLDVVELINYSEEDVREMFERLQNGTPLNAAEKRHAKAGGMADVVRSIAERPVFASICAFKNSRYAFEDVAAKLLHEAIAGRIVDIRPTSIDRTYESNQKLTENDPAVQKLLRVLGFLERALKGRGIRLKRFAILSLCILVAEVIDQYNLSKLAPQFGEWYETFEQMRVENEERDESDVAWDAELFSYSENARNDSVSALTYRHRILKERLFAAIRELTPLHRTRLFSQEQRSAIFVRDGKSCKICGKALTLDDMHADHVLAYSVGGPTTVANGQALCEPCNLKKSASQPTAKVV